MLWIRAGVAESDKDREQRLAEHDAVFPPEDLGYLWDWFKDLSGWRESGFGVGPISHQEILAWNVLFQIDPPISPFEVDVIRKIDIECRSYHANKEKENEPKQSIGDALAQVAETNKVLKEQDRKK